MSVNPMPNNWTEWVVIAKIFLSLCPSWPMFIMFYMGARDLNSGPRVYTAGASSIKLYPRACLLGFTVVGMIKNPLTVWIIPLQVK